MSALVDAVLRLARCRHPKDSIYAMPSRQSCSVCGSVRFLAGNRKAGKLRFGRWERPILVDEAIRVARERGL